MAIITDIATFSRASQATYWDAGRVLRTAAAGQWRLDHDPVTGEALGYLAEAAITPWQTNNNDLALWTPLVSTVTPAGQLGVANLFEVRHDASLNVRARVQQSYANMVPGTYTLSAIARRGSAPRAVMTITPTSGAPTGSHDLIYNWSTGQIDNSTQNLSNRQAVRIDADTVILSGSFTVTATATLFAQLLAAFGTFSTPQTTTWGLPQLVSGNQPSSFVIAGAARATRAADVMNVPVGSWFNSQAGTMIWDGYIGPQANDFDSLWSLIGSGNMRQAEILMTSGALRFSRRPTSGSIIFHAASIPPLGRARLAMAWEHGRLAGSINGGEAFQLLNSGLGEIADAVTLNVGHLIGARQWIRPMRSLNYLPRAASNAELVDLSRIAA